MSAQCCLPVYNSSAIAQHNILMFCCAGELNVRQLHAATPTVAGAAFEPRRTNLCARCFFLLLIFIYTASAARSIVESQSQLCTESWPS